MLNSQLKSLNRAVLEKLKPDQHYIAIEPYVMESSLAKKIEVGDIISLKRRRPKFIVRTKREKIAEALLVKRDFKEGLFIKSILEKREPIAEIKEEFSTIDMRLAVVLPSEIREHSWIGFGWAISSNISIFVDDVVVARGRLVKLKSRFGVEVLRMEKRV